MPKKTKETTQEKATTASSEMHPRIAFFGTPEFAVTILEELKKAGFMPALIVTNPDKPQGRKLVVTPPPVKVWAEKHAIKVAQPESLKNPELVNELRKERWDMFIVAAYGKLIPRNILELPLHNTLNVHPSLLPKFRGASPIQSAMLADEKNTGVSIMILDEEMDHGPVLAQETYSVEKWPKLEVLEQKLGEIGGALLAKTIPKWITRDIEAVPQDHRKATFIGKISKADGELDLSADGYKNFLKIQAFSSWPGTYFFVETAEGKKRVKVTEADFRDGKLEILKVIPEGRKEISYEDFLKTQRADK